MNKDDKDRKVKLLLQTMGLVSAVAGSDSYMSQDPNDFGFFDNQSESNDCRQDKDARMDGEQDG